MRVALKSLQLNGEKAEEITAIVRANKQAVGDLRLVSGRAGEIASESTIQPVYDFDSGADEVDGLLEKGVNIANRRSPAGGFLFGGGETKKEPFHPQKNSRGKITEVDFKGDDIANEIPLGGGIRIVPLIAGESDGTENRRGLLKDSRNGSDLFGHLVSLRDNLEVRDRAAIKGHDVPALFRDEENLTYHFGEVTANQLKLDAVKALAADIQNPDNEPLSRTLGSLGEIHDAFSETMAAETRLIQGDVLGAIQ